MSLDALELVAVLPVSPQRIYEAWLDAREHSAFTGSKATIDPVIGGAHSAWDGYITGQNLVLEPGRRIVQSWRSTEFPDDHDPSRLELLLETHEGGTRLTLRHSEIPEGQGAQYEDGWKEHYLEPMADYFAGDEGTVTPLDVVESALDEAVDEILEQTRANPGGPAAPRPRAPTKASKKKAKASKAPPAKKAAALKKAPAKRRVAAPQRRRPVRPVAKKKPSNKTKSRPAAAKKSKAKHRKASKR
jgi:uncharacterized protein YndB with AHSA1/START domain